MQGNIGIELDACGAERVILRRGYVRVALPGALHRGPTWPAKDLWRA